jgi:cytochrome b involved in lipid metabolism
MSKTYSLAEVAKHRSRDDAWVVVDGHVLDVTRYLHDHPGGEDILLDVSGRDASREFAEVGHSADARTRLLELVIGCVRRATEDDLSGEGDARRPTAVGRTRADAGRVWVLNAAAATGLSRARFSMVAGAAVVVAVALIAHRYLIAPQLRTQ